MAESADAARAADAGDLTQLPDSFDPSAERSERSERIRYRLFRSTSASSRWVARRFTETGQVAVSGLVFFAVFGSDTSRATTYQAFAFLLAIFAIAFLTAPRSKLRLEVRRRLPRVGTAGEPVRYTVTVTNRGDRPLERASVTEDVEASLPTRAEFSAADADQEDQVDAFAVWSGWDRWISLIRRRRAATAVEQTLPTLAPGESVDVLAEIHPERRGVLTLRGVAVARTDPFAIVRSLWREPEPAALVVLPKRYPLPHVPFPGQRRYQKGGVALSSSVGESDEFISLRDYRSGDPIRHIHWRTWAKVGKPIVKEYEDEYFVRNALVLDTFCRSGPAFEEAVSVAASFAYAILSEDSLLDLLFVERDAFHFTAGRGLGTIERLLEVLAGVQPASGASFEELRDSVLRRREALSSCVCVLTGWDDDRRDLLHHLRAAGIPLRALLVARPGDDTTDAERAGVRVLEAGRVGEGLARL